MTIATYNDLISQFSNDYFINQPLYSAQETSPVVTGGNTLLFHRCCFTKALPSLPTGVSGYIATKMHLLSSAAATEVLFGKLINLGSLNVGTNTFTDGSAMPTQTELGVSRAIPSAIFLEVTTALNATPGSFTVTYKDQDNNAAETTTAQAFGASSPLGSGGYVSLNTGDYGAIDITNATQSGGTTPSGVVRFWGMIPFGIVQAGVVGGMASEVNLLTNDFVMVQLGAADVVGGFAIASASVKALTGNITFMGLN